VKGDVIAIINLLREEKILADTKDLSAFIKYNETKNKSLAILESFGKLEKCLLPLITEQKKIFNLKELNGHAENHGCVDTTPNRINTLINFWAIKNWVKRQNDKSSKNYFSIYSTNAPDILKDKYEKRQHLAMFIVDFLYRKNNSVTVIENGLDEHRIEFSVHELKDAYLQSDELFKLDINIDDVEDTLFYLSRIEAIKIEGGFLVSYNSLTLERLERDNKRRYKAEDYQKLGHFYENKVEQIHIVGEYAKKMIENYRDALQFVEDYFRLNYSSFLNKYFKGSRRREIRINLTPEKFNELFGQLSPTQLAIVKDAEAKHIVVAAGPGSGKTKVLVHKLASLMLIEDVKHEQLLMLTFSRAAATEFKKRLLHLIKNAANFIEIKTFHSYCFDLLGKVGSLEKSEIILRNAVEKIKNKEVEISRITKTVLVIDEAQDMNIDEFNLVAALIKENDDMRVIAVGDDDQNIYGFRGAHSKYMQHLMQNNGAVKYELIENYRSKTNLVDFANAFSLQITQRLKTAPIIAKQPDAGQIKIVRYRYSNLITPLVDDVVNTPFIGTTCILTRTNEEALQITGLLLKAGMQARLIQTNDHFSIYNMAEARFFLSQLFLDKQVYAITNDVWEDAKRAMSVEFKSSDNWPMCETMIREFEATNTKLKYKSDLEVFIRESKLEDFYPPGIDTIFVSTIHKAKGKEFDNLFLVLENFVLNDDDGKRQLYVAITRAKQNLTIHLNTNIFDQINVNGIVRIEDKEKHAPPAWLSMHLIHEDVWLDFFYKVQETVVTLKAGDDLIATGNECSTLRNRPVLEFSTSFSEKLAAIEAKGYKLKSVKVNFVIYWRQENTEREIMIVLPKLYFER
jgi:ATP-dependent DNA helicase RecQ